jgi:DNA repair protein REV1 C-terminal domain
VIVPPQKQPEQPSLSGATDLADVRMLLKEWFQSTDIPEEEDREAVCRYLVSLVCNHQLDHVEPLLLFLNR